MNHSQNGAAVHREEIAHLAYLNWQKDGCPHGHDQTYWLEAERQLRATKHLLTLEIKPRSSGMPAPEQPTPKKTRTPHSSRTTPLAVSQPPGR